MKIVLYVSVTIFLVFAGYASSEEPVTVVSTELQQVSLFKNGLGFFVSEVTIPNKVKSFSIIPDAAVSHGTFWVSYPPKVAVVSVIAKQVDGIEQVEPTTMADLLKANIGKKVKIYLSDKAESAIDGKILNVTEEEKKSPPNPYEPGTISGAENTHYYGVRNMVILDTSQGQIAISADRILRVDFTDKEPVLKCEKKSNTVRLDISLKKAAGGQKLLISYLAKGVNWAPSYMLDITEPNNAKIAAKAEIMNEV